MTQSVPGLCLLFQAYFDLELSTKFCDDGFHVNLGYFGHFCGTTFLRGESQQYRFLLELEDWITAGLVSARAGAEATGGWIRGKWKVVKF